MAQGSYIEFNSDPEDDEDPEDHLHSGKVISRTSDQIRVMLDDDEQIMSYFMDEIEIINETKLKPNNATSDVKDESENENEDKGSPSDMDTSNSSDEEDVDLNNNTSQSKIHNEYMEEKKQNDLIVYNNTDQKAEKGKGAQKTLSLKETLKTNKIQKPYWWEDTQYGNNNVIDLNLSKQICNEISARLYVGVYGTDAIEDVNQLQIQSIQNFKLWKMYQSRRQISIMDSDHRSHF